MGGRPSKERREAFNAIIVRCALSLVAAGYFCAASWHLSHHAWLDPEHGDGLTAHM